MHIRNGIPFLLCLTAGTLPAQVQVLIDFGSDSTFRGVAVSSPDTNGNSWNSVGYGFAANLLDTSGAASTLDYAPDGLGGVDSYNGPAGATTNPPTAGEIAAADAALNKPALGVFGVAEAAMDYFVSNGTGNVGRFQIQQLIPGQEYTLSFFASHKFTGADTTTIFRVFDDAAYTNQLGTASLLHGDGGNLHNDSLVASITGLIGPSNANNIFYIQWEGATGGSGFINAMSITAVPEPSTLALLVGCGALGAAVLRRRSVR